jgi:hypothetical protein
VVSPFIIEALSDGETPAPLTKRIVDWLQSDEAFAGLLTSLNQLEDSYQAPLTDGPPDLIAAVRPAVMMRRTEAFLTALAREMPERTSLRQALAFVMVALATVQQREVTASSLQLSAALDAKRRPILGSSLPRGLLAMFDERLIQEVPSKTDRRAKALSLTDAGQKVLDRALANLA